MRVVTFKLDETELELLDRFARKYRLNRSELLRNLINDFINEELSKEATPTLSVKKGPRLR